MKKILIRATIAPLVALIVTALLSLPGLVLAYVIINPSWLLFSIFWILLGLYAQLPILWRIV